MGLFGTIKNILFEDDEEDVMPTYPKEETSKEVKVEKTQEEVAPKKEEPIETNDRSFFKNVKRDIDEVYDEDIINEVHVPEVKEEKEEFEFPKPVEEKKSPFQNFDAEEFERLNSRIEKNESRFKEEKKNDFSLDEVRRVNSNVSATNSNRDTSSYSSDSYKPTTINGKKPFKPSPVISPVYGILDKNYTKDDLVDRKGGLKRETIVKPVISHKVTQEEIEHKEKVVEKKNVNIDSVREKAYGALNNMENNAAEEVKNIKHKEEKAKEDEVSVTETVKPVAPVVPVEPVVPVKEELPELKEEPITQIDTSIEDQIEDEQPIDVEKVLNESIEDVEELAQKKPKKMDDLEKTSTLQILDDIEKELNSIKPISKSYEDEEEEMKTKLERNDTLENDLFNLIDSMYEEGEEEEND